MPSYEFQKIKPYPDPVLKDDGHYKPFDDVYIWHRNRRAQTFTAKRQKEKLPFYASVQHVRNSGMMLMCDEWTLVYATRKISASEKRLLESALDGLSFSCGSPLQEADLELPEQLLSVIFITDLQCNDPVKALYYSADYTDARVHCSKDIETTETPPEYFPQCEDCADKQKIESPRYTYTCVVYYCTLWLCNFLFVV